MSFAQIEAELSADQAFARITHITSRIPSRLAGSENAQRMAEYARDALAEAGLHSRLHEFPGLVSFPKEGALRLVAPETRDIEAFTLGHSATTPVGGVEGELVYVASGAESDYGGRDVRGRIILTELSYSPARHEKAYIAWRRGAAGAVMMNWGDEDNAAVPFGSMKSAWGNPTPDALREEMPDIPCIGIARTEGLRLKALCAAGPVRVRMHAAADNGWRQLAMTSGEVGTGGDRQFLLVGGHMDSWFGPQATDNAAGDACMLELARVFARHQDDLRRGLVVGLWMGHETGTMISSSRFADVNWDRLRSRCVGYLQIDQPAITGASEWHLHSTDDVQAYLVRATREVVGATPVHWGRMAKNGDSSFFGVGLPSFHGEMSFTAEEIRRTALATLGWWHHSIHNTLDKVDRDLLAVHLRVYARWMWDLLTLPVLPFEYRPVAARFVERLGQLASLEVPDLDMAGAVAQARDFLAAAERLDAQSRTWASRTDSRDLEAAAAVLNGAMMRLSRLLVPVASTVAGAYGQDRYGHAWQTEMIPTLAPYAGFAGLARDSEEYRTWWVAMVRARNRVADTLGEATRICAEAVARLG
jgi:hypothetical protein